MSTSTLRITEIFHSLQGETNTVGLPTVFVRLTGCPLRCQYCDTAYAFSGGESMEVDEIIHQVGDYSAEYVTVTGGEPLAQPNVHPLLSELCDKDYSVSLETSGALPIKEVDQRVTKIVDFKTPGSKEMHRNDYHNLEYLLPQDQVKFVICDRQDYDWVKLKLDEWQLSARIAEVLLSPSFEQLQAKQLADWMLEDKLSARLQIQLHKLLWGDKPGV